MKQLENKKTLYSGVQPSGNITIGNYIGAIRQFTLLSDQYNCLFCVVDLHALTVRQIPAELRRNTLELFALYIAAGLDPEKNIIYCQSHVPEHAELTWILNCFTYMGELSRMTQFKDKSARNQDNLNAGLFTYPVLMASDILLYQTSLVPVGEDQRQHLEITRDIAERFNNIYGNVFVVPDAYIPKETSKILSLSDPLRKMSKSEPDGAVFLLDSADDIRRKIRRAVTDSDGEIRMDPENKPGVSNLLQIYSAFSDESTDEAIGRFEGQGYGQLKKAVSDAVIAGVEPIQKRYQELIADKGMLHQQMMNNAERARQIAARTLRKVYKKVGLYQG